MGYFVAFIFYPVFSFDSAIQIKNVRLIASVACVPLLGFW